MLRGRTYEEVCRNFKWQIPKYYNIGVDVCDKWADDKNRVALIYANPHGQDREYTFRELKKISNRLTNESIAPAGSLISFPCDGTSESGRRSLIRPRLSTSRHRSPIPRIRFLIRVVPPMKAVASEWS